MSIDPDQRLRAKLLEILQSHAQGISEHDLLKQMRSNLGVEEFAALYQDQLQLFQVHFVLFHLLYQLRDELLHKQQAHLEINTMRIKLAPYSEGRHMLGQLDAMRTYYLDLGNLRDTSADDLDAMLNKFWYKYLASDERLQALARLELTEPVDFDTIKHQYRKLCMQHHPDRAGDATTFQAINHAMHTLKKYYAS